jgi:TPR repeat protein
VAARGEPSPKPCAAFAAALLLGALPGVAACAPSAYAGIPFAAGAADPDLQALAGRAQSGDKRAQLELGIRYEEGRGVPRDLARARKLYVRAATDEGGIIHVYSPRVGKSGGRVIPLNLGPRRPGLAEAKARLEQLP